MNLLILTRVSWGLRNWSNSSFAHSFYFVNWFFLFMNISASIAVTWSISYTMSQYERSLSAATDEATAYLILVSYGTKEKSEVISIILLSPPCIGLFWTYLLADNCKWLETYAISESFSFHLTIFWEVLILLSTLLKGISIWSIFDVIYLKKSNFLDFGDNFLYFIYYIKSC